MSEQATKPYTLADIVLDIVEGYPVMVVNEVRGWLEDEGYDGLCGPDCGCPLDDLFPCGRVNITCRAGYKHSDGSIWSTPESKDEEDTE